MAQGDKVGALLILVFGKLSLSETREGGHECVLRQLMPGEVVGEFSLLNNDVFPVTVTAIERSVIVKVLIVVVVFIDKQQDKSSWTPSYSQPPEWALDYSSLHQSRLG